MSSSEEPCLDYICTQVGQSCFESCSETCEKNCDRYVAQCSQSCSENCEQACSSMCQEACDQMCQDACNQMCQNACSSSTSILTSFIKASLLLSPVILTLVVAILVGMFQAFDPKGPILLTIFGSSVLTVSLSGVRLTKSGSKTSPCQVIDGAAKSFSSRLRWFTIHHSHHPKHLIIQGHEFKIANKYFCTGCYGLCFGTVCAILIASLYMVFGLNTSWALAILPLVPCLFIPILLRYTLFPTMPTSLRFFANSLIPISWCLLSISLDALLHNWVVNVVLILIIVFSAYLRSAVASKDNSR